MKFEVEIIGAPRPVSPLRPGCRAGVLIDLTAYFIGDRVLVNWATARHLIFTGRAKAAPGVTIPLLDPEARR